MRKIIIALLVCACAAAAHAKGTPDTGNDWLYYCPQSTGRVTNANAFQLAWCMAYVRGVAETLTVWHAFAPDHNDFCIDDRVTNGQVLDMVTKWIKDNPNKRHDGVKWLVFAALVTNFKCKAPKLEPVPQTKYE
jgi:hypothetical protein